MVKGTQEHANAREEEIVSACEKLYETMGFKEITIKEIGAATSFTRTSIYNYFQTREEIFLALLKREYGRWADRLRQIVEENERLSKERFADLVARSLEERPNMLKLLSMNLFDIEDNSRVECLTEFKAEFRRGMEYIRAGLNKFFAEMSEESKTDFVVLFFPFIYGVYPHSTATEKQRAAMQRAGVEYVYYGVYEMSYKGILKLLN